MKRNAKSLCFLEKNIFQKSRGELGRRSFPFLDHAVHGGGGA
jgi:hypothetical protein